MTDEEKAKIEALKKDFYEKHRAAEKAAYLLFGELEVGPERTRMAMVYENIRNATRVPL